MKAKKTFGMCGFFLLAALVCGAEAPQGGEPKSITVTGLNDFEGEQGTIAVLRDISPRAGGTGEVRDGVLEAPLLSPKDRVSPWTGSGSQAVWVVLGDVAANKTKKDKTSGLAARIFANVDFSAAVTAIKWEDGKPMPKFELSEFVDNY